MHFTWNFLHRAGLVLCATTQAMAFPTHPRLEVPRTAQPLPTLVRRHDYGFAAHATPSPTLAARQDSPICLPTQDPDAGNAGGCSCSGVQGIVPVLCSTGDSCNPCGYTTTPSAAAASSQSPYIYTDSTNGYVIQCQSSTTGNAAVNTLPTCAGSSTVVSTVSSLYAAHSESEKVSAAAVPEATVNVGLKTVKSGYLLGQNLTDAVSGALAKVCASVEDGNGCEGQATFGTIYVEDASNMENGDIVAEVILSTYPDTAHRDALIGIIAATIGQSATAQGQCQFTEWKRRCPDSQYDQCFAGYVPQCEAVRAVNAEILYTDPNTDKPVQQAQMSVKLHYANDNPELLRCGTLLGLLSLGVGMIPGGGLLTGTTSQLLGATSFVCLSAQDS